MFKYYSTLLFLVFFGLQAEAQVYIDMMYEKQYTFEEIIDSTERYFDIVGRDKGMGYKPYRRWRYEAQRSLDENGMIKTYAEDMQQFRKFVKGYPVENNKTVTGTYTEMGPTSAVNTSTWSSALGRFSAVGLDINDPDHVIVGSPTGGIWRTIDKGNSWVPLYDYGSNMDIRSLEISHSDSDKYFAGTSGEILISEDGGLTWDEAATGPTNRDVNTIIMDPTDDNILLATDRNGKRIWRSTDGGYNWSNVHSTPGNSYDIEFKPGDHNTVYASGSGFIAKSTDNGATWTNLSGPWLGGVIMMAVTPDAPDYIYALQETSGGYHATFRSTNGGTSWTTQSDNSSGSNNILTYNQNSTGGQAPRDMDIVVNPDDKDEVYVAGTELWKSEDSGVNFSKVADWLVYSSLPFIHADVDLLYYNENGFYAGTDGGLFVSTDNATSWTDWTAGTGVRQFYRIGASETDPDRVSGGSQDNGTGTIVSGTWYDWVGADGMETFIDWSDEDVIYTNIQFGGLYKTVNGGQSRVSITNTPGSGAWVTPMEQDPQVANTLYQAKAEVYKSTNGGSSWSAISSIAHGGNCRELEVAPSDNQTIYASWGSVLYKTNNGGTSWDSITPPGGSHINYIDAHPTDPDRVVLAMSGKIFESLDGGTTWSQITYNLPNITYYCAIYANDGNDGIFAGGRPGIYFIDNSTSNTWINASFNMPAVQVRELEIRNGTMYVATYGRGLWKADVMSKTGFDCANATVLNDEGSFTAPGPNHGNGCHNCTGSTHANWYIYTPPADGFVSINSCLGGEDTNLFVYDGNCANLNQIANSDDDCEINYGGAANASEVNDIPVTAGTPIYIEWDDKWSDDHFIWHLEFCMPSFTGASQLTGSQSSSMQYETDGAIDSDQIISGSGTNIIYDAKMGVELLPGFEILQGALLKALTDGCGGFE